MKQDLKRVLKYRVEILTHPLKRGRHLNNVSSLYRPRQAPKQLLLPSQTVTDTLVLPLPPHKPKHTLVNYPRLQRKQFHRVLHFNLTKITLKLFFLFLRS